MARTRAGSIPRRSSEGRGISLASHSSSPFDGARRAVVVSFDHLHAGYVGCCGNDWIETPSLDRLATEAVVFDQHFCENLDAAAANHAWWTGRLQFPLGEGQQRQSSPFVEAAPIRKACARTSWSRRMAAMRLRRAPFGEVHSVMGADGFDVSETETPFARVVQHCGDWLNASAEKTGAALLWIKTRGVPVPWVPPQPFAELYLDEFGLSEEADYETESDDEPGNTSAATVPPEDEIAPEAPIARLRLALCRGDVRCVHDAARSLAWKAADDRRGDARMGKYAPDRHCRRGAALCRRHGSAPRTDIAPSL